jgi:8-oxo-dGTP pyrophosphatase MutT (NUDIX family)
MDQVFRQAARLLVIDPEHSVLLFKYEDGGREWWATPGGGLEGDETFEQAAVREAAEELAVTCTLEPLWCQTVEFSFRGQSIQQVERYFLVHVSRDDVALGGVVADAHRREGIVAARWWSVEEIEVTSERVFPEDLFERLRDVRHRDVREARTRSDVG